ncbi:MAG TPA: hypothetical protein VFF31_00455 [Blastocatellia bacterium]|jgi:hypothetical protein|nr:hypothetical protein [Blastocatellia bacterium]
MLKKRETAAWVIPLVGDHFDLEDLPRWLAGQSIHVAERDGAFELVISVAIIGDNYEPVRAFAEEQLDLINGVGRLLGQAFRPLSLADKLFGIDAAGTVVHTVLAVGTAEMRVKAGSVRAVVGGKVQPDPREAAASPLLRAASLSPRARDALTIVGRPALTWSELYLLFELVQADVGGQMFDRGWISRADADLFTHTANSYSTLRSDGRHGKDRGEPPAQQMLHGVATKIVCGLVLAWLRHLGSSGDVHRTA